MGYEGGREIERELGTVSEVTVYDPDGDETEASVVDARTADRLSYADETIR